MTGEAEAFSLIGTKLQRPRLPTDLIHRRRLVDRLQAGLDRKLTLISAQAGAGKTTLLAQWLADAECPLPSAWLSLDEHDNDLIVFVSYLIGAVRTVFPSACEKTLDLLGAADPPSLRVITTSLVNDLDEACRAHVPQAAALRGGTSSALSPKCLILALDDYQTITEPEIHQLVSALLQHLPQSVHLALASRSDPPLPILQLRARREMTEIRFVDLRFTPQETNAFLQEAVGREVSAEATALLAEKAEGWIVGLRLAALSMRVMSDDEAFAQRFKGTSSAMIVEYLLSEVLARQSSEVQDFVLRTSVLDRFCSSLCESVIGVSATQSQETIEWITQANLFLVPLDEEGRWYRYHRLFRSLLQERLRHRLGSDEILTLHARASKWFDQAGLTEEALNHSLAAGDMHRAAMLVESHRHEAMNGERWRLLRHWLDLLPREVIEGRVHLLLIEAWLVAIRFRLAELLPVVERVKVRLEENDLPVSEVDRVVLRGEIAAMMSFVHFWLGQGQDCLDNARQALKVTPPEHRWVRGIALTYQLGAYHLVGQSDRIHNEVPKALAEDRQYGGTYKHRILLSLMFTQILAGNLRIAEQSAIQLQALAQPRRLYVTSGMAIEARALIYYLWNDLDRAKQYYARVAELRHQANAETVIQGLFGLALTYQAMGEPDLARQTSEAAFTWGREVGDSLMLIKAHALASRLALLQGQVPDTSHWSVPLGDTFSLMLLPEIPHLTLARALIARATPSALQQAIDLLARLRSFAEATHDTWHLIEIKALQALLQDGLGERENALVLLEEAIQLAQLGGFVRLFVDLGPAMAEMLGQLRRQGIAVEYITQILAAFAEQATDGRRNTTTESSYLVLRPSSSLMEPLTPRELEVLSLLARHLTNRQIAEELVISPVTVKTHTLRIYRKLDVRGRQQAVARAQELDIL
jgi:LuxR family maltose regulon positive regulatory protein